MLVGIPHRNGGKSNGGKKKIATIKSRLQSVFKSGGKIAAIPFLIDPLI
jgi:hypothetical protein